LASSSRRVSKSSVINSRTENTGFNKPARRVLHGSLMLVLGSCDPNGAPDLHELLRMCATLYPGRNGCERGDGNRNIRFPSSAAQLPGGKQCSIQAFLSAGPFDLRDIAERVGAALTRKADGYRMIENVQTLRGAGPGDLAFFDNRKDAGQLADTLAGACILAGANAKRAPSITSTLTTPTPYRSFAQALHLFYPDALRSKAAASRGDACTLVHPPPGSVIGSFLSRAP
jgi:hypothetical protein